MSASVAAPLDRVATVLFALSVVATAGSFAALPPVALAAITAMVAVAARGARRGPVVLATAVLLALWLVNVAVMVPFERLATFSYWRWHGRALIAPAALLVLSLAPLRPSARALERSVVVLLSVMSVFALWGRLTLWTGWPPGEVALGGLSLTIVRVFEGGEWFVGLYRHHEVAGGAYAIGSLLALALLLRTPRGGAWGSRLLLCAGTWLGLALALARAYWGGFLVGAAALGVLVLVRSAAGQRRVVLVRAGQAVLLAVVAFGTSPGIAERIGLEGLGRADAPVFSDEEEDDAAAGAAQTPEDDSGRDEPSATTTADDASGDTSGGRAPPKRTPTPKKPPLPTVSEQVEKLGGVVLFTDDPDVPPTDPEDPMAVALTAYARELPGRHRTWWDRRVLWEACREGFAQRPLTGFGIGMFPVYYRGHDFMWSTYNVEHHAHNNVFQLVIDTGLIGLAVALAWVVVVLVSLVRAARRLGGGEGAIAEGTFAAVVCLMAGGIFDTNVYAPTLMLPVVVITAWLVARCACADADGGDDRRHAAVAALEGDARQAAAPHAS